MNIPFSNIHLSKHSEMLVLNDCRAIRGQSALLQAWKQIEEMHAGKEKQINRWKRPADFIYTHKDVPHSRCHTWSETQRPHHRETPDAHYDWFCSRDEDWIFQIIWEVLWCYVWLNTNLEADGSSWPRRDMMLIKVLIPKEWDDRWCLCWSVRNALIWIKMMFRTLLPHVHVMHFPVSVLGLPYAAVGQRVTSVIRIHPEIQMMTGMSHCQLSQKEKQRRIKRDNGQLNAHDLCWRFTRLTCSRQRSLNV